jgi:methyl acetate hydrolase
VSRIMSAAPIDAAPIDAVLRAAVDGGEVPNVVAIAADRAGVIYQGAAGPRIAGGDEADQPVAVDSVFRIASMTKPMTTAAALQLFEAAALDLDAPVEQYVPAFGNLQVLDGFDAGGPVLRPPRSRATVRQLATHTSGLSYWFWNADIGRWEQLTGTPRATTGHSGAFRAPLACDPGTRFEYGISADWLGRVVEAVSGDSLDAYVEKHITGPLQMRDTSFHPDDARRARLVPVHRRRPGGDWLPTDLDWNRAPDWWSGGHGLYSTPLDFLRFQQALLGGGATDGVRILRRHTVEAAFTGQIGRLRFPPHIATADPASSADVQFGEGLTWGLGLLLTMDQAPGRRSAGSGSWAGIYNTHFWVDPRTGITAALYTQLLPFVEPGATALYTAFEEALYDALRTGSPR